MMTSALAYCPARGDLVLTPLGNAGLVTHALPNWLAPTAVSVYAGGQWHSFDPMQLVPSLTNEPRPRVANFAILLPPDLESFAPGFRTVLGRCTGCGSEDIDLEPIPGRGTLCPECVAEFAEETAFR
jgi:hypothetical protein